MFRTCFIAVLVAIVGAPAVARAAPGWTYEILHSGGIAQTAAPAINDLGHVVYAVREPQAGGLERGAIRVSDGVTTTTVYQSTYAPAQGILNVVRLGINNHDEVVFFGNLAAGAGSGLFRVSGGAAIPVDASAYLGVQSTADINDAGGIVFKGDVSSPVGTFGTRVVTARRDGSFGETTVFSQNPSAAASGLPVINNQGDTAISVFETISGQRLRMRLWRSGAINGEDTILSLASTAGVSGDMGLNALGFVSAVVSEGTLQQRLMMVVPSRIFGLPQGTATVAETGGTFLQINVGSSINDQNTVAFSAFRVGMGTPEIFVKDVGVPPLVALRSGEPLAAGGEVIHFGSGAGTSPLSTQTLNNRGQLALAIKDSGGLSGQPIIIRATPTAGMFASAPIFPAPGDVLPGGGWTFRPGDCVTFLANTNIVLSTACYFDPPVASGYAFTAGTGTLRFARVVVPAPLPGGDASFNVEFNGGNQPLVAGEQFDFETFVPGGVSAFRITGIDLAEGIDPNDAAGFVTGLTFAAGAAQNATFTMVPIVENTDDFDGDGVIASQDNCPNVFNADQADGDADGVGTVCDNCPTTSNPSQQDGNGNGIGDACEVTARLCSVDADGDIDRNDITLITAARNKPASGPNDPRDVDLNRIIDVNDARICTLRCDRAACAVQ